MQVPGKELLFNKSCIQSLWYNGGIITLEDISNTDSSKNLEWNGKWNGNGKMGEV